MKKKFLAVFSIVFVMAFTVAVFAFNQSSTKTTTSTSCPMSDNCPLKNKNAQTASVKTNDSCCDNPDCCCKTGACPMKAKGEKGTDDCCDDCCGGSCPMQKKEAQMTKVSDANLTDIEG